MIHKSIEPSNKNVNTIYDSKIKQPSPDILEDILFAYLLLIIFALVVVVIWFLVLIYKYMKMIPNI